MTTTMTMTRKATRMVNLVNTDDLSIQIECRIHLAEIDNRSHSESEARRLRLHEPHAWSLGCFYITSYLPITITTQHLKPETRSSWQALIDQSPHETQDIRPQTAVDRQDLNRSITHQFTRSATSLYVLGILLPSIPRAGHARPIPRRSTIGCYFSWEACRHLGPEFLSRALICRGMGTARRAIQLCFPALPVPPSRVFCPRFRKGDRWGVGLLAVNTTSPQHASPSYNLEATHHLLQLFKLLMGWLFFLYCTFLIAFHFSNSFHW